MKWTRPGPGCCQQCKAGGMIYTIMNEKDGEYYLGTRPDKKSRRKKFDTFRAMYQAIAEQDPEDSYRQKVLAKAPKQLTEKEIRDMIRYELTFDPFAGGNLRTYCRNGQDYAVDMVSKEIWPYWLPQRVSPIFGREKECREWADEYLEERYGQITLLDLM